MLLSLKKATLRAIPYLQPDKVSCDRIRETRLTWPRQIQSTSVFAHSPFTRLIVKGRGDFVATLRRYPGSS